MSDDGSSVTRRALLAGGVATAAGVAGSALGYRERASVSALQISMRARPLAVPDEAYGFARRAREIKARQQLQTTETVAHLQVKYQEAVFGRLRVWDLIEKLAFCIDPASRRLYTTSQYVHVQQIVAAMHENGVDDPDFILVAVLHDLGKVLLLTDELPENVVCVPERLTGAEHGVGLSNVLYQFGHGEFIHSRIVGHVPDHVAWTIRYHNVDLNDAEPFLDARERKWADRYLAPFQHYDYEFASPYFHPQVDMDRVREIVESNFPKTILF